MPSAVWMVLVLFFAACSPQTSGVPDFSGTPVARNSVDGHFRLTDHRGRVRQLEDFRGKVVVLFFGYTHCPDVCPTTMTDLARAVNMLGGRRSDVQVLFVTLDPERDTQQVLSQYVPAFDPEFLGLRGEMNETSQMAKRFGVYYRKQDVKGRSGYVIDHSAGVYVFDERGTPRVYFNYKQKPEEIAHDLNILIHEN